MGAAWGGLLWIAMLLLGALWSLGKGQISWMPVAVGLPLWAFGGLAFGFFMWFFLGRKPRRTNQGEQDGAASQAKPGG